MALVLAAAGRNVFEPRALRFPGLAAIDSLGALAFGSASAQSPAPTVADAKAFLDGAEAQIFDLGNKAQRAGWVQENFITVDTEAMSADANEVFTAATVRLSKEAHRFDGLQLPPEMARKMRLLKLLTILPSPNDPAKQKELAQLEAWLDGEYGKGKWCPEGGQGKCLDVTAVGRLMATSRNAEELRKAWIGWHAIGAPMRDRYARMVELANEGARELGFHDAGEIWRSQYDMPPDQFAKEVDRIWEQLRPF